MNIIEVNRKSLIISKLILVFMCNNVILIFFITIYHGTYINKYTTYMYMYYIFIWFWFIELLTVYI